MLRPIGLRLLEDGEQIDNVHPGGLQLSEKLPGMPGASLRFAPASLRAAPATLGSGPGNQHFRIHACLVGGGHDQQRDAAGGELVAERGDRGNGRKRSGVFFTHGPSHTLALPGERLPTPFPLDQVLDLGLVEEPAVAAHHGPLAAVAEHYELGVLHPGAELPGEPAGVVQLLLQGTEVCLGRRFAEQAGNPRPLAAAQVDPNLRGRDAEDRRQEACREGDALDSLPGHRRPPNIRTGSTGTG